MALHSFIDRIRFRREAVRPAEPLYQPDEGKLTRDELGAYLGVHHTPHAEARQSSAVARLAIIALGVSLSINAVLSVAVLQMFPLYKVVPFFVTFSDKSDQIVTISSPKANLTSLDVLDEANVREYVTMRNTVTFDPQDNVYRWGGRVKQMSTNDVYSYFMEEMKPIYDVMQQKKFARSVNVKSITRPSPGYWRVTIETVDKRIGSGLTDSGETRRNFVIDMRTTNLSQTVSYQNRFLNPIGFTVLNYSISPVS